MNEYLYVSTLLKSWSLVSSGVSGHLDSFLSVQLSVDLRVLIKRVKLNYVELKS